jgi:hypothetical protein
MTMEPVGPDQPPTAPVPPRPVDFGLTDADLKRLTVRDMLLAEGLASVIMVLVTVLAIWRFWLWGIPIACAALGLLYLVRRAVDVLVMGRVDRARAEFNVADEAYTKARRDHDEAMDAWESRQEEDSQPL